MNSGVVSNDWVQPYIKGCNSKKYYKLIYSRLKYKLLKWGKPLLFKSSCIRDHTKSWKCLRRSSNSQIYTCRAMPMGKDKKLWKQLNPVHLGNRRALMAISNKNYGLRIVNECNHDSKYESMKYLCCNIKARQLKRTSNWVDGLIKKNIISEGRTGVEKSI